MTAMTSLFEICYIMTNEQDPNGLPQHAPGAKLDAGKMRPALVLGGFARALIEVCKVGTYGAVKYTPGGWTFVDNGVERYDDAGLRHWLIEKAGQDADADTDLLHASHQAWNALARLDLMLRKREETPAPKTAPEPDKVPAADGVCAVDHAIEPIPAADKPKTFMFAGVELRPAPGRTCDGCAVPGIGNCDHANDEARKAGAISSPGACGYQRLIYVRA